MAEGERKGMVGTLVPIALVAALGFGGGFAGSGWIGPSTSDPEAADMAEDAKPDATAPAIAPYETTAGAGLVVPLPPIVTNLREPTEAWVRLELSAVFADQPVAAQADAVHADALALMRSLSVREIASPSGFLFLRAELRDRARVLTDGAVHDVLVRTFLIE